MEPFDDVTTLSTLLPGRWILKATNFPMWLSGERREPRFEYGVRRTSPLTLSDTVSYRDVSGREKQIHGTDTWNGRGFTWRMRGIGGLFVRSHWEIAGVRQGLLVIRFEKSSVTPAGVDIVVGDGVDATELRTVIAGDPAGFGLALEEFASLTWLDHLPALE
jgi:hypothetical protein